MYNGLFSIIYPFVLDFFMLHSFHVTIFFILYTFHSVLVPCCTIFMLRYSILHSFYSVLSIVLFHSFVFLLNILASICCSWRHLQHVFSVTILPLPRRLEDVLKTCPEDVLNTCFEAVLKTLWRKAKYLLGISVSNKSKCVSNKSIFNKSTFDNSKANPKRIK